MERVSSDSVLLKYDAKNWEDAVRTCGGLLEKAGCVQHSYVDAMVDTVRTLGPYIVIAPGLAMPHARRSDGVLKSGISIVTLREPIPFGNADNDPVHMLVGLAGVNDDLHLTILAAIADIFEDEQLVYEMAEWDDANRIAQIFNERRIEVE